MSHTTLGVDLAAQPKNTAYCLIEWVKPKARLRELRCGADDAILLEMFGRSDKIGIDAPFGWPTAFASAVYAHQHQNEWPEVSVVPPDALIYRATDLIAREHLRRYPVVESHGRKPQPLSVSSDRIGITAMRTARLLSKNEQIDRSGRGRFVEVYPAAALHIWGLPSSKYKDNKEQHKKNRRELTRRLITATETWLDWPVDAKQACEKSDDALDAVVAALIARAAATDQIEPIPQKYMATAKREGWIALPRDGSLASLAADV